jgi:hypothetical protein
MVRHNQRARITVRATTRRLVMKFFSYSSALMVSVALAVSCSDSGTSTSRGENNSEGGQGGSDSSGGGKDSVAAPNSGGSNGGAQAQGGNVGSGGASNVNTGGSSSSVDAAVVAPRDAGITPAPAAGSPAELLGKGDHSASSVKIAILGTTAGCLSKPSDLAFNPRRKGELWAINYGDESVCIITDASASVLKSERRQEDSHSHFMARPMALAFGGDATTFGIPGTFATANDSAGDSSPDDGGLWNGTSLFSSDLAVFGKFKGPDGNSHLDMLHDSPLARGIAWEKDNIYWVFGSMFQDITRYDYVKDHERGNFDHGDGLQWHYVAGQVKGVNGVPSHMYFDAKSKSLYVADTGNKRIARLDTTSGTINPKRHTRTKDRVETKIDAVMDGAKFTDLVPASAGLVQPSGIEMLDDVLFVSDFSSGIIYAFDLEGKKLNWLDTGLGAGKVAGLAVGPDRKLYFAAMGSNALYVVSP